MKRILILAEGQTEETFIRDVLKTHLNPKNIHPIAKIINTKIVKDGANFKGGVSSYSKIKNDLVKLFTDTDAKLITTMFDYYALPEDFPGKSSLPLGTCFERVGHLELQFQLDIDRPRFLPNLQLHEFESLLFSSPQIILQTIPEMVNKKRELEDINRQFSSPEEINDGPITCPSRRLLNLFPGYKKPLYGGLISGRIGLSEIRDKCNHFDKWLSRLEAV